MDLAVNLRATVQSKQLRNRPAVQIRSRSLVALGCSESVLAWKHPGKTYVRSMKATAAGIETHSGSHLGGSGL